jgi:hypothetical protein
MIARLEENQQTPRQRDKSSFSSIAFILDMVEVAEIIRNTGLYLEETSRIGRTRTSGFGG